MKLSYSFRSSVRWLALGGSSVLPVTLLAAPEGPARFADPRVGTAEHGHAFPGATVPFGMVQLSPDTRTDTWDGCSGYHYSDSRILGFSHTHLSGTGVGGLGDILLMPTVGRPNLKPGGVSSAFSHKQEDAQPGYYKVFLQDPKVLAELSATDRAGYHHYTFPKGADAQIVLDLRHGVQNDHKGAYLKVESPKTISGYRMSDGWGGRRWVYFVAEFSRPFKTVFLSDDSHSISRTPVEADGKVAAAFGFDLAAGNTVDVRIGISATGVEGARLNLHHEIPAFGFAKVRASATQTWNRALSTISIEAPDLKAKRTFYSNMYLSFLAPNTFGDVDGAYWGLDHKVHRNPGFTNYSTFSLWDTFRALHPLLTLSQPQRVNDMVRSLVAEYQESGYHNTPVWPLWGNETWCMIGYHSVPVIVEAYFKGFRGFDPEVAYQAMRDTAMQDRNGLDTYKQLGYVASRPGEAATSKTLEYAYDDWCLARMAEALGHKEDAAMFYRRASNYRNHFDRNVRLMRGRKANGTWRAPFDQFGHVGDEYTEADAWPYSFFAPQDVPGLAALYGGDKGLIHRLDDMFAAPSEIHTGIPDITGLIGQFAQGNEQCHHIPYLYAMAGAPWKTQYWVRRIMNQFYNDTPGGQTGNVDCGQMSAWYSLSAIGLYPVNTASAVYIVGSPAVSRATLKVAGGKTFAVVASGNSAKNIYIQSATLNGKPFDRAWIRHEELQQGGVLRLVMGPKPKTSWASSVASRPPATMPKTFVYAPLPEPSDNKPVVLQIPIRVIAGRDEEIGDFVGDPNMLEGSTNGTDGRIDTNVPNAAPAEVYLAERYGKDFAHRFPVPAGTYTVRLHFAELFDSELGFRRADYFINGKKVLANFDILKEAGGMRKAVVREFSGIRPDEKGQIVIRVKAVADSPDQNAKISGIEILPAP